MNTHADKIQKDTMPAGRQENQSVANEVSQKQSDDGSAFHFVDNRPEAVAQSKLQDMANNNPRIIQLRAVNDLANNSSKIIQLAISNAAESATVDAWVANANNILGQLSPDSITEAAPSNAVRLRWYDVTIGGLSYLVGVNIHYGGAFGALWVKNNATQETNEYHPLAPPQHGLSPATLAALQLHVYEFDTVLHYKATHPAPADGDWDRQFAGA